MTSCPISPELSATALYDGRRLLGYVVEQANGQFEAAPAHGSSLGLFTNQQAAAHAIVAKAMGLERR